MHTIRIFACIFFVLSTSAHAQQGNYSNDAIERLNLKFRQLYAEARAERLSAVDPVVVARGDELVLLHQGDRVVGTKIHPNYHDLKTIAHVPLAIFCVLGSKCDQPLATSTISSLTALKGLMQQATTNLEKSFSDADLRKTQKSMLDRCSAFLSATIETESCTETQLSDLIDTVRPLILTNVETATRLRIDNYHHQMQAWKKTLSSEEWNQLYVVIPGASLARKNETAVQYFSKLLGERGEGKRIIYAEAQFEEKQDLQLLGTYILDTEVGIAFFGDPWRMQRDLLASAADSYLDSLDFTP